MPSKLLATLSFAHCVTGKRDKHEFEIRFSLHTELCFPWDNVTRSCPHFASKTVGILVSTPYSLGRYLGAKLPKKAKPTLVKLVSQLLYYFDVRPSLQLLLMW